MAATISEIFDCIAPDLAENACKDIFIDLAKNRTSLCYGKNYNLAVALRAAHMTQLSTQAGNQAGSVVSKREGDLAISYANGSRSNTEGDLGLTSYGKQLLQLRIENIHTVGVTGGALNGVCC